MIIVKGDNRSIGLSIAYTQTVCIVNEMRHGPDFDPASDPGPVLSAEIDRRIQAGLQKKLNLDITTGGTFYVQGLRFRPPIQSVPYCRCQ